MSQFIVNGGRKIHGEIKINGAKNAVLPILAATILNGGTTILHGCPKIQDVYTMIEILERVGAAVSWNDSTLIIDTSKVNSLEIPENLVTKMRSSIILMGSFLGKFHEVKISYPGGCSLGPRPIDMHLRGLEKMGVVFDESHGFIYAESVNGLEGCSITLEFPSVGATENIILAAVLAKGTTIIKNAALEPEIIDLQNFLVAMGAKIKGAGSSTIIIEGTKNLYNVEYTVMPDRIEAGTYLVAGAITKGDLFLQDAPHLYMIPCIEVLEKMGCSITIKDKGILFKPAEKIKPIDLIITRPYPGFPTDMQPQFMSLLTMADGTSIIKETVFSSRFKQGEELIRMGADIKFLNEIAIIKGKDTLTGAKVHARDLRGGVALILAALVAEGQSTIYEGNYVERGYEAIEEKLQLLGADIKKQ